MNPLNPLQLYGLLATLCGLGMFALLTLERPSWRLPWLICCAISLVGFLTYLSGPITSVLAWLK